MNALGRECATSDDDDTGLTDPDAAPEPRHNYARDNALAGLSDALINWCVSQALPVDQCAGEMLSTRRNLTATQREWLYVFCHLWDLTT